MIAVALIEQATALLLEGTSHRETAIKTGLCRHTVVAIEQGFYGGQPRDFGKIRELAKKSANGKRFSDGDPDELDLVLEPETAGRYAAVRREKQRRVKDGVA